MRKPEKGLYQARVSDDYILAYTETKQEAIDIAVKEYKTYALRGGSRNTEWFVGIVIDIDSNTEYMNYQMSDGTGRYESKYNTYDVVVTSTVAFGKATYNFSQRSAHAGSQGRTR